MDPRENCIDLKPGSFLLILPSFLDSEEETRTFFPFFIPSPRWFCLGQELKAVPVASGVAREPRVGNKAIPIACRRRGKLLVRDITE